jgi:hypothetical protein
MCATLTDVRASAGQGASAPGLWQTTVGGLQEGRASMSANHPPNCPRYGGSGFLNRPTGVGLQTERIPCGVRSQMVAEGGRVPPRRDRPGRKYQVTPPKNLAMKTYTVRLFRKNLDDEPAQEWAVVAESVAEAKQALREHFGGIWTWPRIDVAAAAAPAAGPAGIIGQVSKD